MLSALKSSDGHPRATRRQAAPLQHNIARNLVEAVDRVDRPELLDTIASHAWGALADGLICDDDASAVAAAVTARRLALTGKRTLGAIMRQGVTVVLSRAMDRLTLDQRRDAYGRRARRAHSGRLSAEIAEALGGVPPAIAAALDVIAVELMQRGYCDMPLGKIAALAGCCRSTVRNALRLARAAGLIDIAERRISRFRNLTNLIRFATTKLGERWKAWLSRRRGGGVKNVTGTDYRKEKEGLIEPSTANPTICASVFGQRWRPA